MRTKKILLIAIAALLSSCSDEGEEALKAASPNGKYQAIVMESSEGSTTSYYYRVCVVQPEEKCSKRSEVAMLYDAARSRTSYGVNLLWTDNDHLEIRYLIAKQATISRTKSASNVLIELKAGIDDPNAKPGAMTMTK